MSTYIDPLRLRDFSDVLGKGKFGIVFKGLLNTAGRWEQVAIKQLASNDSELPPQTSQAAKSGKTAREQFMEEIENSIAISRKVPHAVKVYGWTAGLQQAGGHGSLAMVMKLYTKSLYRFIDEQDGPPPIEVVVKLALQIAQGLQELHANGILYEDFKPQNVLLDADGNAFLADFGLSRPMQDASKLYTGTLAGTYFFMPPEKIGQGKSKIRLTCTSDMWSFAITVLQLLQANTMAPYGRGIDVSDIILQLKVDKEPPAVPAVPEAPRLQPFLQACLDLDSGARPSAARAVQELSAILSELTRSTASPSSASVAEDEVANLRLQLEASEREKQAMILELERMKLATGQSRVARETKLGAAASMTCVSGSGDKTLRLWDLKTGSCKAVLKGHEGSVRSVVVTPDGLTCVSGSDDRTLRLWDLKTGSCKAVLKGHENWVRSVVVNPDGLTCVSGSDDGPLRLWDLKTGSCKAVLKGHENWVCSVVVTPDGLTCVSGSWDNTLRLWDLKTGSCKAVLKGHENSVCSVVVTPDG